MRSRTLAPALATAALCLLGLSGGAQAHFRLLAPASWTVQGADGSPQKAAPCGGNGGAKTNAVTMLRAGQKLMITISEEVPHPGHYRVSLGARTEFKDPMVMTKPSGDSLSAVIQNPPVMPVIGDGLWVHTFAQALQKKMQSFEVAIPDNFTCAMCTLQVTQFMADHAPGFFYYHCADVSISAAAPGGPDGGAGGAGGGDGADGGTVVRDAGGPDNHDFEDGGSSGTGGSTGSGGAGGRGGAGGSGTGGGGGRGGAGGSTGTGGAGGDDTGTGGSGTPRKAASGGCAVGGGSGSAGGLLLVAALGLIVRRRRHR